MRSKHGDQVLEVLVFRVNQAKLIRTDCWNSSVNQSGDNEGKQGKTILQAAGQKKRSNDGYSLDAW